MENGHEEVLVDGENEPITSPAPETGEVVLDVGVSEELFVTYMCSIENLLVVQIAGAALLAACAFAILILRFWHVR